MIKIRIAIVRQQLFILNREGDGAKDGWVNGKKGEGEKGKKTSILHPSPFTLHPFAFLSSF
jgi:hypothetical protein